MLSTKQLSEALAVNPETIRRMVKRGQIPCYKISASEYRFDLDEVLDALHNGVKHDGE